MHLSRRLATALVTVLVATSGAVASAPSASAGVTCNGSASVNSIDNLGQTFVVCTTIKTYSSAPPASGRSFVNWTPPVCWLEPQYSSNGLKAFLDSQMPFGPSYVQQLETYYSSTQPPYHNGESGMFWGVGCRTDDLSWVSVFPAQMAADGLSMNNPWVWIAAGAPVTQPNPVTPTILAQYAAAEVIPPALTFGVNPGALQTVHLSTRIYSTQPAGTYQQLEAQARIADMTSTVVATPSDLIINPGGPASTMDGSPASEIDCPIVNGTFGSPDNDSCAFYYTKATPAGTSYQLTASIKWTYTWVENPGALNVTVQVGSNPQNVPVQEVQAIVGGQSQ